MYSPRYTPELTYDTQKLIEREQRTSLGGLLETTPSGESIIFTFKKVLGEHLTAKKATNQRQQTRFRIIAYNAYKKTIFIKLLKHFYTANRQKDLYKTLNSHYSGVILVIKDEPKG